jgi:CrcB protein
VVALVGVGAAAGAVVRFAAEVAWPFRADAPAWPWGTFTVNLVGCLLMGVFLGRVHVIGRVPPYATPLITTGFLGGLTTFSTFALEAVVAVEQGLVVMAAGYTIASVLLGILAVRLGWLMVTRGTA